tara:strand:- start:331 stop:729 length:399 start_codon:yes stop_codon:yes gene_type:complete
MKTNKQEREAIANRFYKKMEAKMVDKNEAFKKSSTYKKLTKLRLEKKKMLDQASKIGIEIQKGINSFNKENPSEYWNLSDNYNYRSDNSDFHLALESSWSVQTDLCNAILIAQVGAENVADLMKVLEQEVKL